VYLQITTRCNMECAHCCYSCTSKGDDMDWSTFCLALETAELHGACVTLGGGEPTIHPLFREFVHEAWEVMNYARSEVSVITNGKHKENALWLREMAMEYDCLHCYLSNDPFHEEIDPVVESAYAFSTWGPKDLQRVVYRGRAKKLVDRTETNDRCVCCDWFVKPNGEVYQCGCEDAPLIGSVYDGYIDGESGYCYLDPALEEVMKEKAEEIL